MDSKNQTPKREIKFRGKRIDTGEWVVGNLVMVCNGETLKRYPCIVISYNHDSFDWHEVHPDSVGQFTGLKDKHDKEIYEGDIISGVHPTNPSVINWGKEYASFTIDSKGWAFSHYFHESCDPENIAVIGNIYENTELL